MTEDLKTWAVARLKKTGWLPEEANTDLPNFSLKAAFAEYQAWFGLPSTGELDPATKESLERPRFCGHPDQMATEEARRSPIYSWQWFGPALPTVPTGMLEIIQQASDGWSAVCPVKGHQAAAGEPLALSIISMAMDGRNGVLADCQLPGPATQQMRIDNGELWQTAINLLAVLIHEWGHFLGLGHLQTPNCLMNPYYNPNILKPQAGDIQAIQQLYPGAPAITPGTTPTPIPSPGTRVATFMDVLDQSKVLMQRYQLTKV